MLNRIVTDPHSAPEAHVVFDGLAAALLPEPGIEEGTGFGANPGLRTGGKIFAMLVDDALVVKLPADRCAELTAAGSGDAFEVGRRRMREWVRISEVNEPRWHRLAREAQAYVQRSRGEDDDLPRTDPPERSRHGNN